MNVKVFLFHRISPHTDPVWPPISPTHFEKIVSHLKKKFEIVPLEETVLGNYIPGKSKELCAITFDDGYKDFSEFAFPIIKKHEVPASMYVITDCVYAGLPPWTFVLNHLLLNTKLSSIEIESAEIPENLKKVGWKNMDEKVNNINRFSPVLKRISDDGRENVMKQIQSQIKDVDSPSGLIMNWDEIRSIKNEGIEIGSHSANHPVLSNNLDLESIKHELKRSGEEIEKETGKFPLAISYPFGMYNNEAKKIAKEVGYKMGLTVFPKQYSSTEDQFEIPRIELYSEPFYKSRFRINGQLQALKNIFRQDRSLNSNE
jgi:peptidoglycan/xylan/chitin deacetylase (PgdA/CDA1 family)